MIIMKANKDMFKNMDMSVYTKDYSENGMWDKVKKNFKSIGSNLLYKVFQLYYLSKSPACPLRIKAAIISALGYFISPIDLIPDITPIAGYSDDIVAVSIALAMAQAYITDDIRQNAKNSLVQIFGNNVLSEIED